MNQVMIITLVFSCQLSHSDLCPVFHLFKMLFWWYFLKRETQNHNTEKKNQNVFFSSSIPGNKYLTNELMLSSVALDRKIASFHSWTCFWSEYQQISYRFAEQDKAVKLWKSINNLSSLPIKKSPRFPTSHHPQDQSKRAVNQSSCISQKSCTILGKPNPWLSIPLPLGNISPEYNLRIQEHWFERKPANARANGKDKVKISSPRRLVADRLECFLMRKGDEGRRGGRYPALQVLLGWTVCACSEVGWPLISVKEGWLIPQTCCTVWLPGTLSSGFWNWSHVLRPYLNYTLQHSWGHQNSALQWIKIFKACFHSETPSLLIWPDIE